MTETPEIPEARCSCDPGPEGQHRYWCDTNEQPTFTASEVKELTTKATEVALALGRMEALTEIADEMAVEQDDERISYVTLQTDRETWGILLAAKTPSQPHQTVSNGPTAPAGQLDLPPTPETPQEGA